MKLLIDTNIIMDILLRREPFFEKSVEIMNLVLEGEVQEYVSASAITDVYYIAYRQMRDKKMVRCLIANLLKVVSIACVSEKEIENALALEWNDFEDSVQYSVALLNDMDGIVTRNPSDYKRAEVSIWSPESLLTWIHQ